jgi:hypothetical protein
VTIRLDDGGHGTRVILFGWSRAAAGSKFIFFHGFDGPVDRQVLECGSNDRGFDRFLR